MRSLELLSPVGNKECLMAAINAGCDAVYLSGINFGARSFAGNFTLDELKEAIEICHLYGVRVYVTVNTLIYDDEVERFMKYIDFLHSNNVDAVIMQDIGMVDLVRKTYPNLEIHASTQMHIHNLEGVKFCQEMGIKRVVLARETPIDLIKEIKKNTDVELEVFVHGALCMSYSGECLISSLIGGRSGNRGTCAQPCRQPYDLKIDGKCVNNDKYLLSTKDLNTLNFLGELIEVGVNSFKIEGRMKSPEYVYLVTSLYRKAIDNYIKYKNTKITDDDIKNLKKIFNREFTKGFLFNERNDDYVNTFRPNHMGIEIGKVIDYKKGKAIIKLTDELNVNDGIRIIGDSDIGFLIRNMYKDNVKITNAQKGDIVSIPSSSVKKDFKVLKTTDFKYMQKLHKLIGENKKIEIDGKCVLKIGKPLKFFVTDGENEIDLSSDYIIEKAKNIETKQDRIKSQLNRLGDTIYKFNNLKIISDDNIFVSISVLNNIRREALNILDIKRMYKTNYKKCEYKIDVPNFNKERRKCVLINTYDQYLNISNEFDTIYVDDKNLFNKLNDKRCVLKLSRVQEHLSCYDKKLLVGELGSVYKYKNVDTDFSLNVTNSYSVALLHSLGVQKITLSYELNYKQIKKLIDNYLKRYNARPNLEVIIEANEEVMISKYNMLKKYEKTEGYLIDKFKNEYKIKIKDNLMYIYNFKKRDLKEDFFDIGINSIRINLYSKKE